MDKLNFGNAPLNPPPAGNLSILQHLIASYKLWHGYIPHITKTARYTLGEKIDRVLIETAELLFAASRSVRQEKLECLRRASDKLDLLKFLLQVLWEVRGLDNEKYVALSECLQRIGKMLGGWLRQTLSQHSPTEHIP